MTERERRWARLTNREDVSFPTDHLIRLSRNEDILPDVCRAACINSSLGREGPEEKWECRTCGTVELFQHLARELITSKIKYVESLRRGLVVILPCKTTDSDANADHSRMLCMGWDATGAYICCRETRCAGAYILTPNATGNLPFNYPLRVNVSVSL